MTDLKLSGTLEIRQIQRASWGVNSLNNCQYIFYIQYGTRYN